jgi:hypothetical protein
MKDNMDINAGEIVAGNKTVQEIGEKIFREVFRVANGKLTKSEIWGHREFAINRMCHIGDDVYAKRLEFEQPEEEVINSKTNNPQIPSAKQLE